MAFSRRLVIIGAGIVGTNLADELLQRGWKNITVVEQGPLDMPGGSTSHAPGLVFQTNASKCMTHLARYTVQKLSSIEKDGQSCFNNVGGLEVATTPERLEEIKRKHGWASSWGIEAKIITPADCSALYPHLNQDRILGGLYIPSDGLALAARAVQLLVDRTRAAGVKYIDRTTVTGIERSNGKVTGVETTHGLISTDIVVCCAGFWGVEVGAMVGLDVPLLPLAHQYVKTTQVPQLADNKPRHNWATLPILRHQDADLYFREHGDVYGIGYYGHKAMPVVAASLGPTPPAITEKKMPSRLEFTSDDFAPAWEESKSFLPCLQGAEIADGFNGIFSFTPDGGPIMGEHPTLSGFWTLEAIWVTHSAGMARALAQILTVGKSDIDVSECELSRFERVQLSRKYVETTSKRNFDEVYDIIHPLACKAAPRNVRVSPFFPRQRELGAFFIESRAWERPEWYEYNKRLIRNLPDRWQPLQRSKWAAQFASEITAVECYKTRTAVGLFDMTPLRRLEITGPGAMHLLQRMTTGDMTKTPGNMTWALMLDEQGGLRTDVIAARIEKELFQVTVFSAVEEVRLQREARRQRTLGPVQWVDVRDVTGRTATVGLWGPRAYDVIRGLSTDDFTSNGFKHHQVREVRICGIPALAIRLSHVGEAGWEIQTSADNGQVLWDAIYHAGQAHGLVAAGRAALNSLRMEAGFRDFGSDFTTEHNPFEIGLQGLVDPRNTEFVGRSAFQEMSPQRIARRHRALVIGDVHTVVMGKEPIFYNGEASGYVTSASFAYFIGKPVVFGWLPASMPNGEVVEIEYFGQRVQATVTAEPLLQTVSAGPSTRQARL